MLHRLVAMFTLVALASGPLLRMAVVGDYLVRKEAYAAACVNLSRPEMQCNGTCQLSKQLKAIEEQGAPNPLSSEWLKLKIGEYTIFKPLSPSFIVWCSFPGELKHIPSTIGKPIEAFGSVVPPPKIG
ncbi:MAG: hypothetical protein ACKOBQ_07145 [Bacteroidota bacterium]